MLYLHQTPSRLALKLFRGEPAISGFDWNFSPIHTSSPPFSTPFYGNFNLDMDRSPGFGSTPTDFTRSSHLVSLRLPSLLEVNLASRRNSPDRSTKSTRLCSCTSTACKHRVSGSLSLPSRGPFHLSFTVLCAIGP